MDERSDAEKIDDVIMPGFRFHPTDEELVGFYLKRKIQQRPLHIELIKQVDIYKHDPWDLPKLAATGEKEWYFYCPRDRKYRNSARPNRVTGAGFWKATGTDRPIYTSDGAKCIGLKKSLVFYRGRAAKGMKTDWMMHEFRLPSTLDNTQLRKLSDKNLPAADSWAICRIFKKINSIAQRALSQAWATPFSETGPPDTFTPAAAYAPINSENISCTTETGSNVQSCSNINNSQQPSTVNFSTLNIPSYKTINSMICKSSSFASSVGELPGNLMFSDPEMSATTSKCPIDIASMLFNSSSGLTEDIISKASGSINCEGPQQRLNGFAIGSNQEMQEGISMEENERGLSKKQSIAHVNDQWPNMRSIAYPFSLPSPLPDAWKTNFPWDSPACPSELSATDSTNKCYRWSPVN